ARVEPLVHRIAALFQGEDPDVRILNLQQFEQAFTNLNCLHALARNLRKFLQVVRDRAGRNVGPVRRAVRKFLAAAPILRIGNAPCSLLFCRRKRRFTLSRGAPVSSISSILLVPRPSAAPRMVEGTLVPGSSQSIKASQMVSTATGSGPPQIVLKSLIRSSR